MIAQLDNFLLSLAAAIADAAGFDLSASPRVLWLHEAVEEQSAPVYSVLKVYGGAAARSLDPRDALSIQLTTVGTIAADTLNAARWMYASMHDDHDLPWHQRTLPGKRLVGQSIETDGDWELRTLRFAAAPGLVGRDEHGRHSAIMNFDVAFHRRESG